MSTSKSSKIEKKHFLVAAQVQSKERRPTVKDSSETHVEAAGNKCRGRRKHWRGQKETLEEAEV